MDIVIRTEKTDDYEAVVRLTDLAFKYMPFSDHTEGELVGRLRKGPNFIEDLSLVAELENKIIGYILFTKVNIDDGEKLHEALALAPISVHPNYQLKGIGSQLIREGLKRAKEKGFKSVIVIGHPDYYPRFGFKLAANYYIKSPFGIPQEAFMALELVPNGLRDVKGTVIYPQEFI
jgi:predicted N-acetyltransferase YhbS